MKSEGRCTDEWLWNERWKLDMGMRLEPHGTKYTNCGNGNDKVSSL